MNILGKYRRLIASMIMGAALAAAGAAHADPDKTTVRLAVVNTPQFSGLIDKLVEEFQAKSGLHVEVYGGNDVYERARAGKADIVISHYGKEGVERFVMDGFGSWPKTVFSNQAVIAGPKSDPAHIRGLTSATEAMRRIAEAKAPFVANALPGVKYLTSILLHEAGDPDKGDWYLDTGVAKGQAIALAEEKQAYVIWGALPFLRYTSKHASAMEIMVSSDPVLQRVMASTVVNPEKVAGVNSEGARSLEKYLLDPATQARIAAYRSPGSDVQLWWPAGRNNHVEGDDGEGDGSGGGRQNNIN